MDPVREALIATHRPMRGSRGWARQYRLILAVSDAFVIALVMVIAHYTKFGWDPLARVSGAVTPSYSLVAVIVGVGWWVSLGISRSRDPRILGHGPQEFQRVLRGSWIAFAWVAVAGFLLKAQVSRVYLLLALPLGVAALLIYRAAWRSFIHARRDAGELAASVVVVGPPSTVAQMVGRLQRARRAGYRVVGVALPPGSAKSTELDGLGVCNLGVLEDPVAQCRSVGAEFVIVSGSDAMSLKESRRLGWALEGTELGLIVAPAMVDVAGPRVQLTPVEGLPLMHVDAPEFHGGKYWLKSAADRLIAAVLIVALSPVVLVIGIAVKATSPGPLMFKQQRIGQSGKPFAMLKFRSMVADAEARLSEVMGDDVGLFYKSKTDPRVTKVGAVLRRYSLDELPQLFNVIKGDMSLVGPRPQIAAEVSQYDDIANRRLMVKPGLTGLWQVSGRSSLSVEESIRLDAYYVENWSITGDLAILARTVKAVFGKEGAY